MSESPKQRGLNVDSSNIDPIGDEANKLLRKFLYHDGPKLDPDEGHEEELPARLNVDPDEEAADELTRRILYHDGPKLDPDAMDELVSEPGDNKSGDAAPPDHGAGRPPSD